MAGHAVARKIKRLVIRYRRALVCLLMARETDGGKAAELPDGCALVTSRAFQELVRPQQWEAVEMLLNLLRLRLPASNGMTLVARGAKLTLVNVGVAVRALGADVRKNKTGVALHAGDLLVHSAERVTRLVVVEFGDVADRLP